MSLDRAEVLRVLGGIAAAIRSDHPEVVSIRLFGSIARADQVGTSDADVLVVVREQGVFDPLERSRTFYRYFNLPIGVDVLVCTDADAAARLASGDPHFSLLWSESLEL